MNIRTQFYFQEISSTNMYARQWVMNRLAEISADTFRKECLPALIVAKHQTEGRGRNGKRWESSPGCLMFSIIFSKETVDIPLRKTPLLALAASMAVRDTTLDIFPVLNASESESPYASGKIKIHWPNDVCFIFQKDAFTTPDTASAQNFHEKKMCGILLDRLSSEIYILGIGLNIHNSFQNAPLVIREKCFSLLDIAAWLDSTQKNYVSVPTEVRRIQNTSQKVILDMLLSHLQQRFEKLGTPEDTLVLEADSLCVQRGKIISLMTPTGAVKGLCTGLDPDGAILIHGKPYHTGWSVN
ncbi:MAG: hypothetical protein Q4C96_10075 [Planctomycetia bacterium]|nr:hypothetical protein [Planctomycetia bacterium]